MAVERSPGLSGNGERGDGGFEEGTEEQGEVLWVSDPSWAWGLYI